MIATRLDGSLRAARHAASAAGDVRNARRATELAGDDDHHALVKAPTRIQITISSVIQPGSLLTLPIMIAAMMAGVIAIFNFLIAIIFYFSMLCVFFRNASSITM